MNMTLFFTLHSSVHRIEEYRISSNMKFGVLLVNAVDSQASLIQSKIKSLGWKKKQSADGDASAAFNEL